MISGFLFLLIIITLIVGGRFGYEVWSDLDSNAQLQMINKDPKKYKIGVGLAIAEHVIIISLAVTLFIAFSPYNMMLGIVWVTFRTGEGLIHIYYKRSYWGLFNIAREYSGTSGDERTALIDQGRSILKIKNSSFTFAQILFSIGTLAYSILFVTYGVVPEILGWFGIVASILYGFGSGILFVIPNFKGLWGFGGLLILIFEAILGGWLLFSPLF
jgi:hypothetical protein